MINKVILVGNAGGDPEVRNFENGGKLARVTIATNEQIYNPTTQERRDHTEWHTLIFNRSLATVVENYVRKGSQIYVEGKLRTRDWSDANGVKHRTTEISVDTMKLLGSRNGGGSSDNQPQGSYSQPATQPAAAAPAISQPQPAATNAPSGGFGTPSNNTQDPFAPSSNDMEDDLPF